MRVVVMAALVRALRASFFLRGCISAGFLGAILSLATVARGQSQTFALDRFPVGGAPDDGVAIWRPRMGETTRFFGQLGLGVALNPLRLGDDIQAAHLARAEADLGTPVTSQVTTYASAGVEVADRVSVQAALPVVLFQSANLTADPTIGANDSASPSAAAAGDLRLTLRAIAFRTRDRTFALGVETSFWAPTGDRFSYGSDGAASGSAGVAAELELPRVSVVANGGFRFRPNRSFNDLRIGDETTVALGAFVPLRDGSLRLGAEVFGSIAVNDGATFAQNDSLEWLVEGRLYTDTRRRGFVSMAGGTRFFPGYSPDARVLAMVGYWFPIRDSYAIAARSHLKEGPCPDADGDGICDDVDLCPLDPEDHKPPNPDDGCPALPDDDGDGIPNAQDACPNAPGPPDPDPKKNGCPVFLAPPHEGDESIMLLKPIEFEIARSTILPQSFSMLDEVVKYLAANPKIAHLAIEGHTDDRGPAAFNEKLSDDRAHAVLKYLVDHGVAAGRLSAKGFGPHRPIADNLTPEGRQKNRRVDLRLKD